MSQGDKSLKGEFFPRGSEAEGMISFFAQSLTTEIPQPIPVDAMPMFTVLTPHYSEKVVHIFLNYSFCIAAHVFFSRLCSWCARLFTRRTTTPAWRCSNTLSNSTWSNGRISSRIRWFSLRNRSCSTVLLIHYQQRKGSVKDWRSSFLFHWFQERCTGIYPSHAYLGFSSRADSVQDCIWHGELLEGDQTDVPRRKPRGCPTSWWKYR